MEEETEAPWWDPGHLTPLQGSPGSPPASEGKSEAGLKGSGTFGSSWGHSTYKTKSRVSGDPEEGRQRPQDPAGSKWRHTEGPTLVR